MCVCVYLYFEVCVAMGLCVCVSPQTAVSPLFAYAHIVIFWVGVMRACACCVMCMFYMVHRSLAIGLLDEMSDLGAPPDMVTFASAMLACERAKQWQHVLRIMDQVTKNKRTGTGTTSAPLILL